MLTSADTRERSPGGRAVLLARCLLRNNTTKDKDKYKDKKRQKGHPGAEWSCLLVPSSCATTQPVSLIFKHTQAVDFVTLV